MPTKLSTLYYNSAFGRHVLEQRESTWTNSSKIDGKLALRSNPHKFLYSRCIKDDRNTSVSHPWGDAPLYPRYFKLEWDRVTAKSYAKFRGKLYKGSASLGVTLGSYKQSRGMIVSRFQQLGSQCEDLILRTAKTIRKDGLPRALGSAHLEVIFGWIPLVQDVHAAATTVIQTAPVREFIRASATEIQTPTVYYNGSSGVGGSQRAYLQLRVTRGALVQVSNPNVWLAERAGLLNPAAVAWDLVPWSFVVNMFSNIGGLVNSITDFAGLTMTNGYRASTARGLLTHSLNWDWRRGGRVYYSKEKNVVLEPVTAPPLVFKIPEANWELAAMAASLFTQKLSRLNNLLTGVTRVSK